LTVLVGRSFGGIAAHHAEGKAIAFSISVFLMLHRISSRLYCPQPSSSTGASFNRAVALHHAVER
jgi:hypothetical protein